MTITKEEVQKLLVDYEAKLLVGTKSLKDAAPDLAIFALAESARADQAEAAMTAVVERAENRLSDLIFWTGDDDNGTTLVSLREAKAALRALAPASGLAMLAELRAGVERLNRWRAEEGEKIKRQAKALTDLTKHCQRIEAENAGLARKIGKVQRGDGDHSQIADLEAKVINQRNELANLRARDGRLAELAVERDTLAAANSMLEAKVAGLRSAFRVNMLRFGPPGTSHEEIDAAIDAALATQEAGT